MIYASILHPNKIKFDVFMHKTKIITNIEKENARQLKFIGANRAGVECITSLRRKRQSMIKLLCNKCNGCAFSSPHSKQPTASVYSGDPILEEKTRHSLSGVPRDGKGDLWKGFVWFDFIKQTERPRQEPEKSLEILCPIKCIYISQELL